MVYVCGLVVPLPQCHFLHGMAITTISEVSLSSLLDLHGLSDECCGSKVSDVHLEKISRFFSQSIQCLAPYLGIKRQTLTIRERKRRDTPS